ncbi:MAG: hypothetical protein WEF86_02400 [Gemmatimonadota bacterium]
MNVVSGQMTGRVWLRVQLLAVFVVGTMGAAPHELGVQEAMPFSCATFAPGVSEADLVRQFGQDNVRSAPVLGGGAEGEYTPGTVLFPDRPGAKVEILWKDSQLKQLPSHVWTMSRDSVSPWRTPEGISIGTDLPTLERINGRPFRLFGFGFDGSGTVATWSEGRLSVPDSAACRMRLSVDPPAGPMPDSISRHYREVVGGREFSSGHPAMQMIRPRVYRLFLEYK